MNRFAADPVGLPDGGLRYPLTRPGRAWLALPVSAAYALLSDHAVWGGGLVGFGLLLFICRPGVTLAGGRIGIARRLGPRWWRIRSRRVADVRRLVVRSDEATGESKLVICAAEGKPLALKWKLPRDGLLRAAHALAERMNARGGQVAVVEERVGFTGERAEQPCLSRVRVREDENGLIFPASTNWRLRRPPDPDRWDRRPACLPGGLLLFVGFVLIAFSIFGMCLHLAGRGHQFQVGVGPFVFARPSHPDLLVRFAESLVKGGFGMLFGIPLAFLGCRLIRPAQAFRGAVRRFRNYPRGRGLIEIVVNPDTLTIRKPAGREIARWPRADLERVEATHVVSVTSGEGGDSTAILTGLWIRTTDGQGWTCQSENGPTPEDWEWIATRLRAALRM